MFADVDLLAMRNHLDTLTAISHEFSLLDKDRCESAGPVRLRKAEHAVFECSDLPLLRPVGSRHQFGWRFPRIELDALDVVRRITRALSILGSDFESMIPILRDRCFRFLAGTQLDRIRAANECGGENKTADGGQ